MSSVTVPLPVDELAVLRRRRSAKWPTYPADVLPLIISETDFPVAEPIAEVLHEAVSRSDTGCASQYRSWRGGGRVRCCPVRLAEPGSVTAVTDVSTSRRERRTAEPACIERTPEA
jgi:hypothetical protein